VLYIGDVSHLTSRISRLYFPITMSRLELGQELWPKRRFPSVGGDAWDSVSGRMISSIGLVEFLCTITCILGNPCSLFCSSPRNLKCQVTNAFPSYKFGVTSASPFSAMLSLVHIRSPIRFVQGVKSVLFSLFLSAEIQVKIPCASIDRTIAKRILWNHPRE